MATDTRSGKGTQTTALKSFAANNLDDDPGTDPEPNMYITTPPTKGLPSHRSAARAPSCNLSMHSRIVNH